MCPAEATEEEIMTALQKYAVLVQGCWVASSALRAEGDRIKYKVRFGHPHHARKRDVLVTHTMPESV
eukprot:6402863-Pyramimonas_sp.AAC.3